MAKSAFGKLKAVETSAAATVGDAPPAVRMVNDTKKQASRVGRKTVIFYDLPEAVRELKRLGVDQDRTIQDLMQEAVDDLLVKYGKHAFGKR
ncbi:ribbon-helix-helix domain-containing protein [Acidisphaera sp. L21]|uniref:ribbon-helix-helix domain-containing protein n=1 Tax=Acidisphaera sp. L21 TaxID=1641851 RepID=UPI00131CF475|nr:ribbon-helix-helix domain-containing protein [Acidisphaera sp. L21]